jgi:hypothetical protein
MFRENVIRSVVGGTNAEAPLNCHVYFVKIIFKIKLFGSDIMEEYIFAISNTVEDTTEKVEKFKNF